MAYMIRWARGVALGWGLLAALGPAATAQVPPLPPEMAEIRGCLCLQQAVSALSAEMNAKNQALDTITRQLSPSTAPATLSKPVEC